MEPAKLIVFKMFAEEKGERRESLYMYPKMLKL